MTELRAKALCLMIFFVTVDILVWMIAILIFANKLFNFNISSLQSLVIYFTSCIFRHEKISTAQKPLPISETMRGIVFLIVVFILSGVK